MLYFEFYEADRGRIHSGLRWHVVNLPPVMDLMLKQVGEIDPLSDLPIFRVI